jgi:uncharacterized Zn-binding protein involved in type VI secretion
MQEQREHTQLQRRHQRRDRGQVVVMAVGGMAALLVVVGMVIDGGFAWARHREVQNAADLASLAGTRLVAANLGGQHVQDRDVYAAIVRIADLNNHAVLPGLGTTAGPVYVDAAFATVGAVRNDEGNIPAGARGVRVPQAQLSWHPFLVSLVGIGTMSASAAATSITEVGTSVPCAFCVIGTNPPPFSLQSGSTRLTVDGGAIASDGGLTAQGNPIIQSTGTGAAIDVFGTVTLCQNCVTLPAVTRLTARVPDPLAFLADPVAGTTTLPAVNASGPGTTVTISPGTYAGITISANATVQLNPGTYYFKGDVSIQSNGALRGTGVTLIFMGPQTSFLPQSNSVISLTAPALSSTEPFPGMAIYYARNNKGTLQLQSSSSNSLTGTIYAANTLSLLDMQSGTTVGTFRSMVVVGSANLQSGAKLNVVYDSTLNVRLPTGVSRLVQ